MGDLLPLRARGPGGRAPACLVGLTQSSTYSELECAVRIALNLSEDTAIILLAGFPPKPLELEEQQSIQGNLCANEVITVREDDGGEATVLQGKGVMKKGRGRGGGGGASKKAAAAAAPASSPLGGGANVHTLNGSLASSSLPRGGGGARRPRKRRRVELDSEEDIGSLLLSAVSAGGGGNRVGQCMRAVFRKAIEKQYDASKAEARVAAARASQYVIEESNEARRIDGMTARIKVTYAKGLGFRSDHTDDVELLSKAQLFGVVGKVLSDTNAREMMKPSEMAGCSPRVFWSLVHHYGHDVEAGLKQLVPTQDWSFLHERTRKLSEKALMNLEQEEALRGQREEEVRVKKEQRDMRLAQRLSREAGRRGGGKGGKGKKKMGKKEEEEEVEEVVALVVDDLEVEGEGEGGGARGGGDDEREKRAQAALARFGGSNSGSAVAAGANGAGAGAAGNESEGEIDSDFPEIVTDQWVRILRRPAFRITCCRDLAAADADELSILFLQHKVLANLPTAEEVQKWISACQNDEMDVIMMDIVNQDEEVLDALEAVHVGTPKDVKLWAAIPNALMDTLARELSEEKYEQVAEKVNVEVIQKMGKKAEKYLEEMPWLGLWAG